MTNHLELEQDKDGRAYEHARDKYKTVAARKVRKEVKERNRHQQGHGNHPTRGKSASEVVSVEEELMLAKMAAHEYQKRHSSLVVPAPSPTVFVNLADLVVKSARKGGPEDDFEVIPYIKSVIVLDEEDIVDVDEGWEHVAVHNDGARSYAAVLAGGGLD